MHFRNAVHALLAVALGTAAMAQTPAPVKKTTAPAGKPAARPALQRFTMDMLLKDRIDPHFAGYPIGRFVEAVEKLSAIKKGEFESTADFNARKTIALSAKFLGDAALDDTFAFVVPVKKFSTYLNRGGLGYLFDADTSELALYAIPQWMRLNGIGTPDVASTKGFDGEQDTFDLDLKIEGTKTYRASNAYGATVTVTETIGTRYGITTPKLPYLTHTRQSFYSNPSATASMHLENARAAVELPLLQALIVVKPATPFISYHFSHSKPTRDMPTESTIQGKYLAGEVLGIVFYSGITGEVLVRLPDGFGKPKAADEKPATI